MDLFAAEIGLDPAEVRRRNLLPPFTEPHRTAFGALYDTGDYAVALDKALAAAGYDELRKEQAERRARGDAVALGIGLASYVEITGMGDGEDSPPEENATVEVHPDGTATILTGTSPHGQGHATAWAMLASEELGIPVDKITREVGRHRPGPRGRRHRRLAQPAARRLGGAAGRPGADRGGQGARRATSSRPAPRTCSLDVERSAFAVAGDPDAAVPLAGLAEAERLLVRTVFTQPGATFPFGTHVAVVEVDTETGKVILRRVVTVDDAGFVLNPLLAEGQRHGGIAQGAAQAFLEEVVYDGDGNPLTASFADYPFLSATEVPSFELADMRDPDQLQPAGRQGHRRGRHDRRDPGRAERGRRRARAPRRPAHRHARLAAAGLAGHQGDAKHRIGERLMQVELTVNGQQRSDEVEPRLLLVHYLREVCGLRAANVGCDTTSCGACTVLLDGKSVKSCTVLTAQARGQQVTTAEGLATRGQEAAGSCTRCRPRSGRNTACSAGSAPRAW